jgi:transcriptional regulator GlxA family with amidase domain
MASLTPWLTRRSVGAVPVANVAVFAYPGVQSLDVVGPYEVFDTASRVLDGLGRDGLRYRPRIVTMDGGPTRSESGLFLGADGRLATTRAVHTLILPGGDGVYAQADDAEVVSAVRRVGERSGRCATVCSGAFLGAAAGLFPAGTRVTTHWARAGRLARRHPELDVDPDAIYAHSGAVWTSAGVTAGIDLALAMVKHDVGAEVAQTVARWLVVFLHRPGGQSQFSAPAWSQATERPPIRTAIERIHAAPEGVLDVAALADVAGLSMRHFLRLFRSETGTTPARYVEDVRITAARHVLETESIGLAPIARRCGFSSEETMRRAFVRRLGVSPDQYRRRFRTTD